MISNALFMKGKIRMSLLFYDRNAGHGELYSTGGQGDITQLKSYDGWRTSWSHIVPSYATDNSQSETTLLFYDKNSGVAQFYKVDAQGNINQLSDSTSSTGWTHIIPGYFLAGSPNTALLFYIVVAGWHSSTAPMVKVAFPNSP